MPDLTERQSGAVEFRGQDACVVAGPGSGKTTVLVERYRSLIVDYGFRTDQILAITFTEKAAANMKSKLATKFEYDEGLRRNLESAWVSTIHGFCARLLRENAVGAGVDPKFVVLDERESNRLQVECRVAAANELTETRRAEILRLIEALQAPNLNESVLDVYEAIRSSGMTVSEVRKIAVTGKPVVLAELISRVRSILSAWPSKCSSTQVTSASLLREWISKPPADDSFASIWAWKKMCPIKLNQVPGTLKEDLKVVRDDDVFSLAVDALNRDTAPLRELIFDLLARFDSLYKDHKQALGALDFNDLERYSIELLESRKEVQRRLREQFRQIMLDEFQDINDQQWRLLELVRGPETLFAVGDINQSIYGFRHAKPEIFRRYQEQSANKHYTELLENFRSRQPILSAVEAILDRCEGIQSRTLESAKIFPEKPGPLVEIIKTTAEDKEKAAGLEARWITHRLLSMRGKTLVGAPGETRPAEWSDFAVLVRTGEAMRPILQAFETFGVPFVSNRRDSFLLSREAKDLTALLHVIVNPLDEVHLVTVLRSPMVGVSDEALLRLRLEGFQVAEGLRKLRLDSLGGDDAAKVRRFRENLHRWRTEQPALALDVLVVRMLRDSGYDFSPLSSEGEHIEEYLHLARTSGRRMPLPEFLEEVESLCEAIDKEAELSDEDQGNRVQVLTIHAAKGLEFPIVFVAAMDKEGQRGSGNMNFTRAYGLGIRWRDPEGDPDGIKDSWHEANSNAIKARENEEQNRLLYVAMTRAEEHLILSFSAKAQKAGQWAAILSDRYDLKDREPSDEPFVKTDQAPGERPFEVSIRVTASEPDIAEAKWTERGRGTVQTIARPALSGQYDSVVSVTALAVFNQCPRKYYLQRLVGAKSGRFLSWDPEELPASGADGEETAAEDHSAAELGISTHALLANVPGTYSPRAHELAAVFRGSLIGQEAAANRAQHEWEFVTPVEGMLVRGVIDLWFERPAKEGATEAVIVDYKTDDIESTEITERAGIYATQIALYALALKREHVRGYLYFLQPDVLLEINLNEAAFERARELVRSLRDAQERFDFPLHQAEHCRRCPYWRAQCPAGKDPEARHPASETFIPVNLAPESTHEGSWSRG